MQDQTQWVIWNGSSGILAMSTLGQVDVTASGRKAWLDKPFDMVGPFSLDELESCGCIAFAACLVMSRQRWQDDQLELRRAAHAQRRAAQDRLHAEQARFRNGRQRHPHHGHPGSEQQHREALNLPVDGQLEPSQIKTAFRRLAQKVHPDVGGTHEQFVRITQARDALLASRLPMA